jgi:heme/copper-type cytochrome/quinol oxidase subunit 3
MSLKTRVVGDVSALPDYGFGPKSVMWWGTIGFMLIEGTGFLLACGVYLYLRGQVGHWPPSSLPPGLVWSGLLTVVLALSCIPNAWTDRQAHAQSLPGIRLGLIAMSLIGLVAIGLRAFEFTTLNERWDHNAYGSIVWALMLLHTTHIVTDVYDTLVLLVVVHTDAVDGRRFSDISDNALYWYFVVLAWLPIYALIYWFPRIAG